MYFHLKTYLNDQNIEWVAKERGCLNITENQPFDLTNKMPSEVHLDIKKELLKCNTNP